ncbi:hypothetical protein VNI00_003331 [Paramarasmius palmivorus]|uniref:Phorbol-ester/DAG-type domain-containing protein n=1 Tax=Paramarasmius palmivorus TaxID=297713 RepID=A0AAW0DQ74_9AGAR
MEPLKPLRINTSIAQDDNEDLNPISLQVPTGVPSFRVSGSPPSEKPPTSPLGLTFRSSQKTSSRKTESRKLLAHVLNQLSRRTMPPSVYDDLGIDEDAKEKGTGLVETVKDVVKLGKETREEERNVLSPADEDDEGGVYSTDATFELMTQLMDVLKISLLQGWKIFDEAAPSDVEERRESGRLSSPFRRRNSLQPGGQRSRSPSPTFGKRAKPVGLLSQCISILSSVILEDCRFQVESPRPSRPPNALQAITLEAAKFLLHTHRHSSKTIADITLALIPAVSTFPYEMCGRLLAFFEECIVRGVLAELRNLQERESSAEQLVPHTTHGTEKQPIGISIQVEAAPDDSDPDVGLEWTPWSTAQSHLLAIKSSNAPMQASALYNMTAIIRPLLAALLERFEFPGESNVSVGPTYRLHRLIEAIARMKFDAYLDALEVMSYHSPKARRSAARLLSWFWPRAIGHVVISKPSTRPPNPEGTTEPPSHQHQFMPWRFAHIHNGPSLLGHACQVCTRDITGFGLFCPLCVCAVHFDCYDLPEGSRVINYSMASDDNTMRVAVYRFCTTMGHNPKGALLANRRLRHRLKPVNVFSLCLCSVCRKPLWGCYEQALYCSMCHQFLHPECTTSTSFSTCAPQQVDSNSISIDWSALRQTCTDFYPEILSFTKEDIQNKTYEDVSILFAMLWTQSQLLQNGIALGTLRVEEKGFFRSKGARLSPFELHNVLAWCQEFLGAKGDAVSPGTMDYFQYNDIERSSHALMYDWSFLVFMSASMKMPLDPTKEHDRPPPSTLLTVSQADTSNDHHGESIAHPFEIMPLSHLRDAIGRDFHVRSDITAKFLLMHMLHVGLFDSFDAESTPFADGQVQKHAYCSFPLPLGLDVSTDVETLFAAVEACLSDLDLFVNEIGWLMLSRRLWPSGSASEYALGRLTRSVVSWILAEDENLATILRDYLAKQRALPGVRSPVDPAPWPPLQSLRKAPSSSVNNGGDYVASRRALVSRYAIPWLAALHDQSPDNYAVLLYNICTDFVEEALEVSNLSSSLEASEEHRVSEDKLERLLRLIFRLSQNAITFSVLEDLFVRWLYAMSTSETTFRPLPSLSRIFQREGDASHRVSMLDSVVHLSDHLSFDPWSLVLQTASDSKDGLQRSLNWLRIFATSGISVPYATFAHLLQLLEQFEAPTSQSLLFVNSMMFSVWLQPHGRDQVQKLLASLHVRLQPNLLAKLKEGHDPERQSLATCLLLYGCDRKKVIDGGLVLEDEVRAFPSRLMLNLNVEDRRKLASRNSQVDDPIVIDPSLMKVLDTYLTANNENVTCLVAKFLYAFLMDSPYLAPHEVDNFILRNEQMLCRSAFLFYNIQRQDLIGIRFAFLLRVIVVDPPPFKEMLDAFFKPEENWEARLSAVTRLFRIILDITSLALSVEGRQWEASITDVFFYFFRSLWQDEKEEIRLAVETLSSTLLSSHFNQISSCWTAFLATSSIADKARLAAFLVQLRPHFPAWQVVSWEALLEILAEDQYDQEGANNKDGALSSHLSMYGLSVQDDDGQSSVASLNADTEMTGLRVCTLILSIDMIANGIYIDANSLLRIKQHVARVVGFEDVHAVPALNGLTFFVKFGRLVAVPRYALPCVSQLSSLLDSPHPAAIPSMEPSMKGGNANSTPLLVGSLFVDVLLGLFSSVKDLLSLPVLTTKSLLESLCIVIYKHNFENIYIRHLQPNLKQAVTVAMEYMLEDTNYECRQLALLVVQAYVKRFHGTMRSIIHFSIEQVAKLIILQNNANQDPLVNQAKAFLENTLKTYSGNGIFAGLLRRKLERGVFVVLKQVLDANAKEDREGESLRESLLRDTLPRAVESDQHTFQAVLDNLQAYVEVVHHQNYTVEMIIFVGHHLTLLARRISEWTPEAINPAPLLHIAAVLMQHNKAHCREMLQYTDTILRVALNRLSVDSATLSRLVHVTSTFYRKTENENATNPVLMVLFEILADGLRMKSRVLSSTIGALSQTIMTTEVSGVPLSMSYPNLFIGLASPGLHFLHNYAWNDPRSDRDLSVSIEIARMVLSAASRNSNVITKMIEQGTEKPGRQSMNVRGWNILLLAALKEESLQWMDLMCSLLGAFTTAHHTALRNHTQSHGIITEAAILDINHAYIAIKLWLILAQHKLKEVGTSNDVAFRVWDTLWPPFEALVNVFEAEAQAGLPVTLAVLTWSTVADLFVYLRNLRSPAALHTPSHMAMLNRLKAFSPNETQAGKLSRAIRALSEPPVDVGIDALMDQAVKDIIATEKLRELEMNRDAMKIAHERRRPEPSYGGEQRVHNPGK